MRENSAMRRQDGYGPSRDGGDLRHIWAEDLRSEERRGRRTSPNGGTPGRMGGSDEVERKYLADLADQKKTLEITGLFCR